MQVKNSTQLYSKLLVRALSHQDLRIRLAAMIAIAETAIDNLSFQMKVTIIYISPNSAKFFSLKIYFLFKTLTYPLATHKPFY
jgi:hypothetical protein